MDVSTHRSDQVEFLERLHNLRQDAKDDPVFAFCIDWLVDKTTEAFRTGEPLPAGIAALIWPARRASTTNDPSERAARVMQELALRGTFRPATNFH